MTYFVPIPDRVQLNIPPTTTTMKLDSAIKIALNLPTGVTATVSTHGSSGFSSTHKVITTSGDTFFLKTGTGPSVKTMFEGPFPPPPKELHLTPTGEYTSLLHLHTANASICPLPISHGTLEDSPNKHYLLTEFLELRGRGPGSDKLLAQKLAAVHLAPPPPDVAGKGFGFPVPTCCGSTVQDNTWTPTWAEFFARRRLEPILAACDADTELRGLGERVVGEVVPRLLGMEVRPALVHGDLWSGNVGGDARVFDPSSCYAHHEFEAGIMTMFGGFGRGFWEEYWRKVPKEEPVGEYADRVELYQL